jgi:hypothetical protein
MLHPTRVPARRCAGRPSRWAHRPRRAWRVLGGAALGSAQACARAPRKLYQGGHVARQRRRGRHCGALCTAMVPHRVEAGLPGSLAWDKLRWNTTPKLQGFSRPAVFTMCGVLEVGNPCCGFELVNVLAICIRCVSDTTPAATKGSNVDSCPRAPREADLVSPHGDARDYHGTTV